MPFLHDITYSELERTYHWLTRARSDREKTAALNECCDLLTTRAKTADRYDPCGGYDYWIPDRAWAETQALIKKYSSARGDNPPEAEQLSGKIGQLFNIEQPLFCPLCGQEIE